MALNDIVRNVITKYKADTTDHKRALTDLKGEAAKLVKMEQEVAAQREKDAQKTIDGFKKVAGAIAGAKLVWDSYKLTAEQARLSTAAAGVDIDKLDKAAGGLKTRMQLLQEAAKLNTSAFKLTGEQMATVELAMRQLTRAGGDQEEVSKKVLDAIVKLEGDGLKDFGIRVREAKTDTEKFNAIMEALGAEAKKVDAATQTEAESIAAMGKAFEDTFNQIKLAIGEMVIALRPLLEAAGFLASKAADIAGFASGGLRDGSDLLGAAFGSDEAEARLLARYGMRRVNGQLTSLAGDAEGNYVSQGGTTQGYYAGVLGGNQSRGLGAQEMERLGYGGAAGARESTPYHPSDLSYIRALTAAAKEGQQRYIEANRGKWAEAAGRAMEAAGRREAAEVLRSATGGGGNFDAGAPTGGLGEAAGSQWDRWMADSEILNRDLGALRGAGSTNAEWQQSARSKSRLEEMFGPVDEINGFTVAFQGLQGAVTAAMDAWITGSMGAGEAMKKFSGEFLKSLSTMLMTESLKHTAYAIASAIPGPTFNPAGIGGHAAAAAAFAGAALLAGAGAKALGGGGGATGGAGAGSAAPTYNAGAGSAPAEKHTTIVVGSAFLPEGSPRQRQLAASKIVETALGAGGVTYAS